jgi:hypothetical protein
MEGLGAARRCPKVEKEEISNSNNSSVWACVRQVGFLVTVVVRITLVFCVMPTM